MARVLGHRAAALCAAPAQRYPRAINERFGNVVQTPQDKEHPCQSLFSLTNRPSATGGIQGNPRPRNWRVFFISTIPTAHSSPKGEAHIIVSGWPCSCALYAFWGP